MAKLSLVYPGNPLQTGQTKNSAVFFQKCCRLYIEFILNLLKNLTIFFKRLLHSRI